MADSDILPRVSALVLAGGQSRRMGRDKALLDFDGAPLIARVIERVRRVCAEVIIVANDVEAYTRFGVRVVTDFYPGKGSLGGVFSGLQAVDTDYALAVACDMPFLNHAVMRYLISLAPEADVILPHAQDPSRNRMYSTKRTMRFNLRAKEIDLHPTHAVYSKRCLAPMGERVRAGELRLIGFLDTVRVRIVEASEFDRFDPQHLSFFNVNTPENLLLAQSLSHIDKLAAVPGSVV